jgi:hypothetical protein
MRGGMTINCKRLGIAIGQNAKIGIFLQRPGKIDEITVGLGGKGRIGQPLADGFGDIEGGAALR